MRTIAIKVKNYANEVNIINNNIERLLLNIMIWSFGALAVLYVLFLGNMVFNIVERRNLEADARALSNEVADLELNYLSLSGNIDLALYQSLGFKEITINYATRKPLGLGSNIVNTNLSKNTGKNEI